MAENIEIEFGLVDTTAKSDGTASVSSRQSFDTYEDLELEEPASVSDIATLEPNFWVLDGSKDLLDPTDNTKHYGWISAVMCGENKTFSTAPAMTVTFSINHTSAGLTFDFGGDSYPDSITAVFYNSSNAVIDTQTVSPNAMRYAWTHNVENYRKIVLTFNSMSIAQRYLKVSNIQYGLVELFGNDNLLSAELLEEVNPISEEIPISTLTFKVHSDNGYFSILNPDGAFKALQQRQKMSVRKVTSTGKTSLGKYFLNEWSNESENVSEMKAVNAIGVLDGIEFAETYYSSATAVSTIIAAIFSGTDVAYSLDSTYSSTTLIGKIEKCTRREALQQVAFAIGAVVDVNRTDTVYIKPAPTAVSSNIGQDVKTLEQTLTMLPYVTGVDVTYHSYSGTTDATGVSSYANSNLPAGTPKNVLQVEDATLISSGIAAAAAQRVYNYHQNRYEYQIKAVVDDQRAGQLVTVESWNSQNIKGTIESVTIDLTGGFMADMTVVGGVE